MRASIQRQPRSTAGGLAQLPRITVPMHGLTRYLHARLEVKDGVMHWEVPKTVLGLLPYGMHRIEVPLEEIRDVRHRRSVRPARLVAGAVLIGLPLVVSASWWISSLFGFLGVLVIAVSFGPRLQVRTLTGNKYRVPVFFGHEMDAQLYAVTLRDLAERALHPTTVPIDT